MKAENAIRLIRRCLNAATGHSDEDDLNALALIDIAHGISNTYKERKYKSHLKTINKLEAALLDSDEESESESEESEDFDLAKNGAEFEDSAAVSDFRSDFSTLRESLVRLSPQEKAKLAKKYVEEFVELTNEFNRHLGADESVSCLSRAALEMADEATPEQIVEHAASQG